MADQQDSTTKAEAIRTNATGRLHTVAEAALQLSMVRLDSLLMSALNIPNTAENHSGQLQAWSIWSRMIDAAAVEVKEHADLGFQQEFDKALSGLQRGTRPAMAEHVAKEAVASAGQSSLTVLRLTSIHLLDVTSEELLSDNQIKPLLAEIQDAIQVIRSSSLSEAEKTLLLWHMQALLATLLEYKWFGISYVAQAICAPVLIMERVPEDQKTSEVWSKVTNITTSTASLINAAHVVYGAVREVEKYTGWLVPAITHLLK